MEAGSQKETNIPIPTIHFSGAMLVSRMVHVCPKNTSKAQILVKKNHPPFDTESWHAGVLVRSKSRAKPTRPLTLTAWRIKHENEDNAK